MAPSNRVSRRVLSWTRALSPKASSRLHHECGRRLGEGAFLCCRGIMGISCVFPVGEAWGIAQNASRMATRDYCSYSALPVCWKRMREFVLDGEYFNCGVVHDDFPMEPIAIGFRVNRSKFTFHRDCSCCSCWFAFNRVVMRVFALQGTALSAMGQRVK